MLGGVLSDPNIISWFSFRTPFYVAAGMTIVAALAAWTMLPEFPKKIPQTDTPAQTKRFIQHFNIVGQLKYLCKDRTLKLLFLASFCFFFAVDTYYEFYPAYLVKIWNMGALGIALLTASLCLGLMFSSAFLSRFLAKRFAVMPTIFWHMLFFSLMLSITLLASHLLPLYVVFCLTGVMISVVSNQFYVQVSEVAHKDQQGEALGMAMGLRTLGDGIISFVGGFLVLISVYIPLLFAIVIALIAALILWLKFLKK